MLKIIQVTDIHFLPAGERRFDICPIERFDAFVDQVNSEHDDAALVVITGDIADYGDEESYHIFKKSLARLRLPVQLLIGNHDNRENFASVFPDTLRDQNGYIQSYRDIDGYRLIFTDTVQPASIPDKMHHGFYDKARLDWLADTLEDAPENRTLIFSHHNPMQVQWAPMDQLMINDTDAAALGTLFDRYRGTIRHLFYGHGHRVIAGNWHGVSYSTMRGTMIGTDFRFDGEMVCHDKIEEPQYGLIFVDDETVTHHIHDYMNAGPIIKKDAY